MNNRNKGAFILLTLTTIIDIVFAWSGSTFRLYSKPLLMPLLAFIYIREKLGNNAFTRLMIAALFFSWLGDIFLMFEQENSLYFILGLASFLTAHVMYILYFSRITSVRESYFRKKPWIFLAVLAYIITLLYQLWPTLGPMRVPVTVYAIVIGSMLAMAVWQYGKLDIRTSTLFISGAILFVISDSALALNRFYHPFVLSGIVVMLTYVAAQSLLTFGSISHLREAH